MKKNVGVLTLFLVTVIFAVTMSQPVYAYENTYDEQEVEEIVDLGTYETTAYVEVFEKVYISEELKAAFDRDGIAYSTESYEVWIIWPVWKETRYRYFYYARTYVEEVENIEVVNKIDKLDFYIQEYIRGSKDIL